MNTLTPYQLAVVERPLTSHLFLHGSAGTGKSTTGVERLRYLLSNEVAPDSILILTSHRIHQDAYLDVINSREAEPGSDPIPATMSAVAWQVCTRFWSAASQAAGFAWPDRPPVFLNVETAQYYMAYVIRPLLAQGAFDSIALDRSRIYSQILDDLNKSATVGFPHTEIAARLDACWVGDPAQHRVYADVQACATRFREFCLEHNLLDFSLLTEVFSGYLWPDPAVREYLATTYRHLIYDNVEEDFPRSHDVIRAWLPAFDSALLIFDDGGGYRRNLGADAVTGEALRELCDEEAVFSDSFVMTDPVARLADAVSSSEPASGMPDAALPVEVSRARFVPEMVGGVVAQVTALITDQGVPPSEIVILAPVLSDSLRFAVTSRLEAASIPWRTLRPSRPLHAEPASQVLLTLAQLAHPHWGMRPSRFDVAYAVMFCLEMDLVRAQMLTDIVYRPRDLSLSAFDRINTDMRDRLTFAFGDRYASLRAWLLAYREATPLPVDVCLQKLYDELLSQEGFGFHHNLDAARLAGSLIDSIRSFLLAVEPSFINLDHPDFDFGREYLIMLNEGVLPALYPEAWRTAREDAVLVSPAYSFLVMNRPASVQFWLDAGSAAWYEGLVQPLAQPYVLSREWPVGRAWTFADAEQMGLQLMAQLVSGLLHRCRRKVVLAISSWSESGFEQRGPMLQLFQRLLQPAAERIRPGAS